MARVLLRGLGEIVGIPQDEIGEDEFDSDFFYAGLSAFVPGELEVAHPPYNEPELIRRYGRVAYAEGTVAQGLATAARQQSIPPIVEGYQALAAKQLVSTIANDVRLQAAATRQPVMVLGEDEFSLGGQLVTSALPIHSVIDYEPGLNGMVQVSQQVGLFGETEQTYGYAPYFEEPEYPAEGPLGQSPRRFEYAQMLRS